MINKKEKVKKRKLNGNGTFDEDGILTRIWKRLVYLPDGIFSLTRLIVVISFFGAILFIGVGTILEIFSKKTFSKELYDFTFKMLSISVISYVSTKVKDTFDKKVKKNNKED